MKIISNPLSWSRPGITKTWEVPRCVNLDPPSVGWRDNYAWSHDLDRLISTQFKSDNVQ
jgi:hypothetical protein